MQHMCVCRLLVKQAGRTLSKKWFFRRKPQQYFWKSMQMDGPMSCMHRYGILDYNRCPLMCEVKRETDGQNTLQYLYIVGRHGVE
jgi:hypothetical protein